MKKETAELIIRSIKEQDPMAEYGYTRDGIRNFSCIVIIRDNEEIVEFGVPVKDDEIIIEETIPAKNLIKWMII